MTLFYYYGSGDFGNDRIRLGPAGFSFQEAADTGTVAMSKVVVDDPLGTLDIVGHHAFRAIETACTWDSLFRGYFADRTIKRQASMRTGAARVWDSTVYDLNAALSFEVIRGSSAHRPKETDTARLAWLLASGFTGPVSTDGGHVFGAGVSLDKADYRGRYMADVLSDCAQVSGNNFWVAWDDTVGAPTLHYYDPQRAHNSSTLKISNVLADVDSLTVYAPDFEAPLSRDPSRVYTGIYYQYGDKTSAEHRTNATVLSHIGHKREGTEQDDSVRTAAKADSKADKWLTEAETELDTISVVLHKVPPSAVNLIRSGQRIQCKFSHMPGYESYTWLRVTRRTVEQDGDTQLLYNLGLELANPKQGGTKRGPRNAPPVDVEDGASVTLTRACLLETIDQDDGHGGIPNAFAYTTVVPDHDIVEGVTYATTYVYGGCPIGQSAYNGLSHKEQWLQFTPSLSDTVGVRFTFTAKDWRGILGPLFDTTPGLDFGYLPAADGPPTSAGQGVVLGTVSPSGGSFTIPSSLLSDGVTNYVFLRAAWQGIGGQACAGDLIAGNLGPLGDAGTPGGGEFNTGQVVIDLWSATTRVVSGSGTGPWMTLTGDIDGVNQTYTLPGWNQSGTPRIRIGPVEYNPGADYTIDEAAGTITMSFAPWPGADLQGVWRT